MSRGEETAAGTSRGISRRRLLASAGAGTMGVGLAAGGYALGRDGQAETAGAAARRSIAFHGEHQAGIATPAQAALHFASFDLTAAGAGDLRDLLRTWSDAAARLMAGKRLDGARGPLAGGRDTGEADELDAASLTITIGLGPDLFERDGEDRLGLRARRPPALAELPHLPGDELDPARCGGDLCIQACADDPQVAFHAVHNLSLLAHGAAVIRWAQLGFGRTSSTTRDQATPRNLMGFKDGTNNIRAEDARAMRDNVWARAQEGAAWMEGGTYLVARRIRMLLDVWDGTPVAEQERIMGRQKASGAPLGGSREDDPVDLGARSGDDAVVPMDAHIRLAAATSNGGQRILRRGYSFSDGVDGDTGQIDAGLFFICFQRDPLRQFAAIQRRLGLNDALSRHISHAGSAVFACPPGARRGGFVGEALFSSS